MKKTLTAVLAALTLAANGEAADTGLDLASRYVWRGMLQDDTPALQPSLTIGSEAVALSAWGSYGLGSASVQEINTSLAFNVLGFFDARLTDYYTGGDFMDFDGLSGVHQIEASVSCNQLYGTLSANVFIYGPNGHDTWLSYGADLGWLLGGGVLDGVTATVGGGNGQYSSTGEAKVTTLGVGLQGDRVGVEYVVNVDTGNAWVVATLGL